MLTFIIWFPTASAQKEQHGEMCVLTNSSSPQFLQKLIIKKGLSFTNLLGAQYSHRCGLESWGQKCRGAEQAQPVPKQVKFECLGKSKNRAGRDDASSIFFHFPINLSSILEIVATCQFINLQQESFLGVHSPSKDSLNSICHLAAFALPIKLSYFNLIFSQFSPFGSLHPLRRWEWAFGWGWVVGWD